MLGSPGSNPGEKVADLQVCIVRTDSRYEDRDNRLSHAEAADEVRFSMNASRASLMSSLWMAAGNNRMKPSAVSDQQSATRKV